MLDQITPLILTHDEACNIERTLEKLRWARRILVVDSGSTDGTLDILARYPQIEVLPHGFTDFARQWNFGLAQISAGWTLSLDADYVLTDELIDEIAGLHPSAETMGYGVCFTYCIQGRPLRASLYPSRVVLFRAGAATYDQDGHTQRLRIAGKVEELRGRIRHDDRKPISRWLTSQRIYARDEALHLLSGRPLSRADRLRRLAWPAPFAVLLYVLFVKGCFRDGWHGWLYALQRLIAESLLALELIERRLAKRR
jgi:glycosyltransferase involved in cell wall biosynthesis